MKCTLCGNDGYAVDVNGVCVACLRDGPSVGVPAGETEIVPTKTVDEINAELANVKSTMLQDALLQTGIAVHPYSGRGMMGKECLAISGEIDNCREAMGEAIISMVDQLLTRCSDPDNNGLVEMTERQTRFNETMRQLMHWRQDTMGHGVVFYWPDIPYDTSEDH